LVFWRRRDRDKDYSLHILPGRGGECPLSLSSRRRHLRYCRNKLLCRNRY
jgi:hypothetical protein